MPAPLFEIDNLQVSAAENGALDHQAILSRVALEMPERQVHALVGPTGSDLSALAKALLGSPDHVVTAGRIRFRGDDITDWATDVRAKVGIFLAFAPPPELNGVSVLGFLHQAHRARGSDDLTITDLRRSITDWMDRLGIDDAFLDRPLNQDVSPAEQMGHELLQLAVLKPDVAVLDWTDGELDGTDHRSLTNGIRAIRADRPGLAVLAISHDQQLIDHLEPDVIHVSADGSLS